MRSALLKIALFLTVCAAARAQVNPHTQIRWPTNCAGDPKMTYNWQANTCVQTGPVGNSGEVQLNQGGIWFSLPGFNYNFATDTLSIPNLAVAGSSAITIPPPQIIWPTGCNANNFVTYNAASNTCFDARNNIQAGTTTTLPAGSSATVTQTGTFPNFVLNFGIPAGAPGGSLSYPGVVTDGSNGLQVATGNVQAMTAAASNNKTLYVMAPPYNAYCDGIHDDQSSATNGGVGSGIQGAFNDAAAKGATVQFPAGTCLTSTIVWKGQSFFGAGKGVTIIKGQPGQDIFQGPDNHTFNWPQGTTIHDFSMLVNSSVNKAATAGGGDNTFPNRIAGLQSGGAAWPIPIAPGNAIIGSGCAGAGTTTSSTTVTLTCSTSTIAYALGVLDPALVIGAPITINGAGVAGGVYTGTIATLVSGCNQNSTVCTITVSPAPSTSVTNASGSMLVAQTPPWYIGNAAFALQCTNSASCPGNASSWNIYNIQIDPTGGAGIYAAHTAGWFTQCPMYASHFEKIQMDNLYGGYIEGAPISGGVGTADTSSFKDMDFFHSVIPMVTYNGNDRALSNINLYAEYPLSAGLYMQGLYAQWSIDGIYSEGGFSQSGEVFRFIGSPRIHAANIFNGYPGAAWIEWNATGGYVDGQFGQTLKVDGNMNEFVNTDLATSNITDNGFGNKFESKYNPGSSYSARRFNPSSSPNIQQLGNLDASFLLAGNSSTPFSSANDFLTTCADWSFSYNPSATGTPGTCVPDPTGTEITRRYYQSPAAAPTQNFDLRNGSTAYQNAWVGQSRTVGVSNRNANGGWSIPIPQTKVMISVNARCVGVSSCTARGYFKDIQANTNILPVQAISFTNTWSTQSWVADFSTGTTGDVVAPLIDSWTGAGMTAYQIAWISFVPVNADLLKPPFAFGAGGVMQQTTAAAHASGHCVQFDANGATVDAGITCAGGSGVADVDVTVPVLTSIPSNTCWGSTGSATPATFTMSGVTTAMGIRPMDTGNPSAIAGWGSTGGLNIRPWASASNQGSYVVCNTSGSAITSAPIVIRMGAQ